jgi:RimJ/RimL family protein N-acetyltransferase
MDVWPFDRLVLRTPRLELRLPSTDQLAALAELAADGVHDPAVMPFTVAWTDLPPVERSRSVLQWAWRTWGALTAADWSLAFTVLRDGEVVGTQEVSGKQFGVLREVDTGSWLGLKHHGQGFGTEMRAAVLHLAFAGLGAELARSAAATDNPASRAVSRRLGYAEAGSERVVVRDQVSEHVRLVLTQAAWERHRTVPVTVEGLAPCLPLLGAAAAA